MEQPSKSKTDVLLVCGMFILGAFLTMPLDLPLFWHGVVSTLFGLSVIR